MQKTKSILLLGTLLVLLNSCKKKEIDNETNSILDFIICEQEFMRIPMQINAKAKISPGVLRIPSNPSSMTLAFCPKDTLVGDTTWLSSGNLPGITFDYGSGCSDEVDGKTRSGKIETRFSKSFDSAGVIVSIVLNNYKSGDLTFSGTISMTRINSNSFSYSVQNGSCASSNWNIAYSAQRTIVWKSGQSTLNDPKDDLFEISGTSEGVNREGRRFKVTITQNEEKKADCKWLSKGVFELVPEGLKTRIVDYGDGACDNEGVFSIDNKTIRFLMQQ